MKKFITAITSAAIILTNAVNFANAQDAFVSDDDLFIKIREAYRKKNKEQFYSAYTQLQQQNSAYPLLAYAQTYDLRLNFDNDNSAAVKNFIKQHKNELITELLIADWLVWLEKQNRWTEILENYPLIKSPSAESQCIFYKANLQTSQTAIISEIKKSWFSDNKGFMAPETNKICEEIFNQTYSINSAFSADEILSRAVMQIENNRIIAAKRLLSAKSNILNLNSTQLGEALDNSVKFLAKNSANINSSQTALLATLAIIKFSQKDPQQAAEKFIGLQGNSNFTPSLKALAWSQIGLFAAKQHLTNAQTWFDYAFANQQNANKNQLIFSDDVYEWAARAALREKNFQNLAEIIQNKMPEHLKNQHSWIYWLARATNDKSLYEKISTKNTQLFNFYNTLADEELGIAPYLPPDAKTSFSTSELATIQADVSIQRALALFRVDLRSLAVKEWIYANKNTFVDDDKLLNSAEFAKNLQIWDREINTSEFTKIKHNFSQRYVAPYSNEIIPASQQQGLDPAWVYGLTRQESRFVTRAKSNVGASGLMQLMPATAKWVANKIGLEGYHHGKVNDHDVNVLLGTSYMRIILEDLEGMPILATAAYNAGPGRAKRWKSVNHLEGAIYAETIPFSETRDYVKKVLNNAVYYSLIFKQPKIMTLKQRLGVVSPKY